MYLLGIISAGIILIIAAYFYGRSIAKRRMRRIVRRKLDNNETLQFAMEAAEDGAMEIKLTKKVLKAVGRGTPVEGILQGQKKSMIFRVRAI
jgi:hypothetical protein